MYSNITFHLITLKLKKKSDQPVSKLNTSVKLILFEIEM